MAAETKSSGLLMFLPRCDVLCASITEQTTGKWNLFVLYKKYISKDLLNQATSLTRDIAVRSVIGLHKSDHVSDVICASVLL